jgi:putative transposase
VAKQIKTYHHTYPSDLTDAQWALIEPLLGLDPKEPARTYSVVLKAVVHSATTQDRDGARLVLEDIQLDHPSLEKVWADGGYRGQLITWVKELTGIELEIIKRNDDVSGFVLLPKRWVVERTFGWFNRFRRMSKDYEAMPKNSESLIYLAMTHIMVWRLGM